MSQTPQPAGISPAGSPTQHPYRMRPVEGMFRFDKTITLGNLITIIMIVTGMLIAWFKMEGRIALMEDAQTRAQIVVEKQTSILQELQISNARISTLMDVYVPEIEQMKHDQENTIEQRQGRR